MKEVVRIIIIEDNPADAKLAEYTLKSAGFNLVSKVAETRDEFVRALSDFSPDLILSDYDLPLFNGAEALKLAKEHCPGVPFILVTGAVSEERAIEILTSGAIDYVMKNRPSRLVPAVQRAMQEVEERKERERAEAERDLLLRNLEARVQERTAQLEAEIAERKRIEESLRESKQSIQTQLAEIESYYDNAPVALCVLDAQMRYVRVNERLAQLSGRPVAEHIGRIPRQIIKIPRLADRVEYLFSLVSESGEPVRNMEFTGEVGGIERTWVTSYYPIKDEKGRIAYVGLVIVDITKRKQAEEALRRSESLLRTIIDNSPDPIFMKDRDGRMLIANPATLAAGGKSADEVIGKTALEEYPDPQSGQAIMENDRLIMESGQAKTLEEIIYHPDGPHVYLSTKAPLHDPDSKVIGLIGIARDITERKQMERALQQSKDELESKVRERTGQLLEANKALRQSEEKYRELVESAQSIILRMDCEGNITFINEFAEKFFGYSRREVMGRNVVGTIVPETESSGRDLRMLLKQISHNPENYANNENENIRKNGERVWIAWTNAPVHDAQGKLLEVLCVGNDFTDRKKMEERLRSAQKNLRAMASEIVLADERSRQHFATDLHDTVVQTMGAAKLRSQLMQDKIPEDVMQLYSEMQDYISQSITQARQIMAEMSPPVLYELGFVPALEWLTEQMQRQHSFPIFFEDKNGTGTLAHEIEVLLFQATRELLMNVIKHSKAESAVIRYSTNSDNRVRIEVIDDGIGLDRRKAFRTDQSSGGFGLFSIRERLRHVGGHLTFRSKPGRGTQVIITAPKQIKSAHQAYS